MKPKNFPGRKNIRRINALADMKKDSQGYKETERKIIDQDEAESIRTKKFRGK